MYTGTPIVQLLSLRNSYVGFGAAPNKQAGGSLTLASAAAWELAPSLLPLEAASSLAAWTNTKWLVISKSAGVSLEVHSDPFPAVQQCLLAAIEYRVPDDSAQQSSRDHGNFTEQEGLHVLELWGPGSGGSGS